MAFYAIQNQRIMERINQIRNPPGEEDMKNISNDLMEIAGRIRPAREAFAEADRRRVESALEAGRLLCQAKDDCLHQQWMAFLRWADMDEQEARKLMQLARAGLTSCIVSEIGGIDAALAYLVEARLPEPEECLTVGRVGWPEKNTPFAIIKPNAAHPGYYDIAIADMWANPATVFSSRKPLRGESMRQADGSFFNSLWHIVDRELDVPHSQREFQMMPADLFSRDGAFLFAKPVSAADSATESEAHSYIL
ncbi:hypothetical protein FJ945_28345 [Mesorhizobium sp. B2-4-9]|uniref:hypothetical protein n=2 Tax=Mesorhizobium TaxID=68287 RepID=UPI001129F885|nr:hypothetical protein [Mesorhizobium sp. B2-4-9]TPL16042.1 hypothetical protein FJ945_28345 [Mesorhizobium sp. B2-4-9]